MGIWDHGDQKRFSRCLLSCIKLAVRAASWVELYSPSSHRALAHSRSFEAFEFYTFFFVYILIGQQ